MTNSESGKESQESIGQATARITKMAEEGYPSNLPYAERARELYVKNRMQQEGFAKEGLDEKEQEELANYVMHL